MCHGITTWARGSIFRFAVEMPRLSRLSSSEIKLRSVENNAGADEAERVGIENTGRDQVQLVHLAVVDHGVAGVVAAGGTDNDIRTGCHNVNDFSFSLVAPLGTDYNICRHKNSSLFQTSKFRMQRTLQHTFLL